MMSAWPPYDVVLRLCPLDLSMPQLLLDLASH
jgi:hypothetical protein